MKYQKLPSGSYRMQITVNGKRVSVTAKTVAELKLKVADKRLNAPESEPEHITFEVSMNKLMDAKKNVLSANTMAGYIQMSRQLVPLYKKDMAKLTPMEVQVFINDYAAGHSPKSCSNLMSFIMTVIHSVMPDANWRIKLPQKKKPDLAYPGKDEVKQMIDNADSLLKRALLICAFGPAREGEICALKYGDIDGTTVHIHATVCHDAEHTYKGTPKTSAGDRYIVFPPSIIKELGTGDPEDFVVPLTPNALYGRFRRLCKKLGLPAYRFHSTRVYGASWLHDIGKSDAYIMQRGGWNTASVLQEVYRKNLAKDDDVVEDIAEFLG